MGVASRHNGQKCHIQDNEQCDDWITRSRYFYFSRGRLLLPRNPNHTYFSRGIQTIQSFLKLNHATSNISRVSWIRPSASRGIKTIPSQLLPRDQNHTISTSPEGSKPYHLNVSRGMKTIPSQRLPRNKTIPSWHLPSMKTIPSWHLPSLKTIPYWHLPIIKTVPSWHLPIKEMMIRCKSYDNHTMITLSYDNQQQIFCLW